MRVGGPAGYDSDDVTAPARRSRPIRSSTSLALGAIICCVIAAAAAEPLTSIPNPRTRDGTWVTDMAGMLRPETIARINSTITDVERTNGIEMALVVIKSLDGLSIEEAAVKLFELWGVGKKNKDNGLLFLWSTGERRVRVEVGYGLEGVLPDGKVGAILDAYVIPRFKSGAFDEGVLAGVDALLRVARNEAVELPSPKSESYEKGSSGIGTWVIGLMSAVSAGIGSVFGFGKWRRHRRRRCPECATLMERLAESEDDARAGEGAAGGGANRQRRLRRVEVSRVFASFHAAVPKWLSSYAKCPQCHNHTKSSSEEIIERANEKQRRERARPGGVRVLQLPPWVHEGPSADCGVELVFVQQRGVER